MDQDLGMEKLLTRGVAEIIVEEELKQMLASGKRLRLKMGFDPSAPDIHLGHVVGLRKLRQFQELGHTVVLIAGDWTAQIGDPSGQSATRRMLSREEVLSNAETYMQQFFKIVDKERTEVRWQSEWFGKFGLDDVIRLTSKFTVAQFLAREDFTKRFTAGSPIAITELLYPLMQAYDSVAIKSDVEFGGTDQKFNILVGRELQRMEGQRAQQVFLVPILVGTDGVQKMSKSLGNYIGVTDPPQEMYGKIMSLADSVMLEYFRLLTDVPEVDIDQMKLQLDAGEVNPRDVKMRLAADIVSQFHGPESATSAAEEFRRIFQQHELPAELPAASLEREKYAGRSVPIWELLVAAGMVKSGMEARRMVAQGAVSVDSQKITEDSPFVQVEPGMVLRVSRRRFAKLVWE